MITVVTIANPLRPTERQIENVAAPLALGEWLMQRWPDGPPGTLSVVIDGASVHVEDVEHMVLGDGAHVLLIVTPSLPAGVTIASLIINALIAMAISAIVGLIFRPKKPTAMADSAAASPVYSISGSQNAARLGEPIPVGYGTFVQVPDFASQPYTYFDAHEMYLCELLVIGQGQYAPIGISDMLVGDSTIASLQPGIVEFHQFGPGDHLQQMGPIEAQTGIMEDVVTSPEVGDQELSSNTSVAVAPAIYWRCFNTYSLSIADPPPGTPVSIDFLTAHGFDPVGVQYWYQQVYELGGEAGGSITYVYQVVSTAYGPPPYAAGSIIPSGYSYIPTSGTTSVGWFEMCKPNQRGNRAMLDFVFAGGLYAIDSSNGSMHAAGVNVRVEFQAIHDDSSDPIDGSVIAFDHHFEDATNTPRRYTLTFDLTPARYRCRCTRTNADAANSNIVDKVTWTGLKLRRLTTGGTVYGNTTLVAVKIKATNGIASSATSRIRFNVQRLLPILGSGALVPTNNPADAFVDILTAPYGAARPLNASEIDLPALARCHAAWNAHNGFNGVIAQKSTVFEALSMALQVVAAGPLPLGGQMSVQVDTVKDSRIAMFTEANLQNLVVGYEFDKVGTPVGVRVEYRDPDSFAAAFVVRSDSTLGDNETDVEAITLFGCTDKETARQYGRLVLNRRNLQRKTITFDTEQEGLMLLPGDRIAVQHQMPRWGSVAIVVEVAGLTLTLDRPLDWSGTPGPRAVLLSSETNGVSASIPVVRGTADHIAILSSAPPFALYGKGARQEPTRIAFGTLGSEVRDWTVVSATPQSGQMVHVEGLTYNPDVYDDAMPHQLTEP